MVKDIVVALLTVTVNRYSDLKFNNMMPKEMVIKELTGILDYVADIPEEKYPIVVSNFNEEVKSLKKRIRELEETCRDNNEVIKRQWDKIVKFDAENKDLKNRFGIKYMEGK